jgi:NADH-quinone oxidoreductase subunit D
MCAAEGNYTSAEMILNMGPSHPATHGIIRVILRLDGEVVAGSDLELGYLHRAFEKMSESLRWQQVFPYTDRLNYVSPLMNNTGYAMAVEKLLGIEVPERARCIRMVACEVSRICDHLTCIGAATMELGAFTAFLYCIEARDLLWEVIESLTGARVTTSFMRIGGLAADAPADFAGQITAILPKVEKLLGEIDGLLTDNRVFLDRYKGTGVLPAAEAADYGFTGPLLRAAGVAHDLRKAEPYMLYDKVKFDVPTGSAGDNFDRYIVRMIEMRESARIIRQVLEMMKPGPVNVQLTDVVLPEKGRTYGTIEGVVDQFMLIINGIQVPEGEVYSATEVANGELGFYLVSDGGGRPVKCRVRGPSFYNLQALPRMIKGGLLADIIPTFGMINMIGGECDR